MNEELSPVLIFAYNRIDELKKTVYSLANNELANETDIYFFLDGPNNKEDDVKINEIENFIRTIDFFKSVTYKKRKKNFGLRLNIISGINEVLNKFNRVIVLEDDIVTNNFFLKFMNSALNIYENNQNVCQISGYSYLEKFVKNENNLKTYFLLGGDCLAWGTWKSEWVNYNDDSKYLRDKILEISSKKIFNRNNSYDFFSLLEKNIESKKSWAINWYASTFLECKYTLYPIQSYALHIGNNVHSTNYKYRYKDPLKVKLSGKIFKLKENNDFENDKMELLYQKHLRSYKKSFFEKVINKLISLKNKI